MELKKQNNSNRKSRMMEREVLPLIDFFFFFFGFNLKKTVQKFPMLWFVLHQKKSDSSMPER